MNLLSNALYSIFRSIFHNRIQKEIKCACNNAFNGGAEYARSSAADLRKFDLERLVNEPVIVLNNEWDNPIIGFAEAINFIGGTHLLVVQDYLTNKKYPVMGLTFRFTDERFELFKKLNPFEMNAYAYREHNDFEHEKAKHSTFDEYEILVEKLSKNSFFERLTDHRKN